MIMQFTHKLEVIVLLNEMLYEIKAGNSSHTKLVMF